MNATRQTGKFQKHLRYFALLSGLLFLTLALKAQDFPKEIRGYKVYRAKISVKNKNEKDGAGKSAKSDDSEAFIKISEPELTEISLTGITFELSAEIDALAQSGTIDFLTFQDFRVNGLSVEVEEYKESFDFKKNQPIVLPKPVKIAVSAGQTLRGALAELKNSQTEWTVTGKVFVFGRFKKAGFKFKCVVPVEINLKIANPLPKTQSGKFSRRKAQNMQIKN